MSIYYDTEKNGCPTKLVDKAAVLHDLDNSNDDNTNTDTDKSDSDE